MEKSIQIGILNPSVPWYTILSQIGVPCSVIRDTHDLNPCNYSVIIINRSVTNKELEIIKKYTSEGGAIIDTGYVIDKIMGGTTQKIKYSYFSTGKLPFDFLPTIIDIYSDTCIYTKAQYCSKTLFLNNIGKGIISFWGLNIETLLFDTRSKRKMFYGNLPRFPHEETSCVSKGEIMRLFFSLLKHLHISRGIPFIHKWFFPDNAKNVFLFRIDSDYGNKDQIKRWYDIAKASNIRYTWFLHVSAHKEWLDFFTEFKEHEIAVHGYDHFITDKPKIQELNVQTALHLLTEKGFNCRGYASPYGLWNSAVNTACENAGFAYSSEFSYLYDSLPLYPVVNNRQSSILQIPIHPICIGSLVKAKADEKGIIEYFTNEFNKNMTLCNPIIFYDHVIHSHSDILTELFKLPQSHAIPSLTFFEFAQWWRKRQHIVFSAQAESTNKVKINYQSQNKKCTVCIWDTVDSYILSDSENPIDLNSNTKTSVADLAVNIDAKRLNKTRSFHWRLHVSSLLNKFFWRKYT